MITTRHGPGDEIGPTERGGIPSDECQRGHAIDGGADCGVWMQCGDCGMVDTCDQFDAACVDCGGMIYREDELTEGVNGSLHATDCGGGREDEGRTCIPDCPADRVERP